MSQAKVDRNKDLKKNRKKIVKKQRAERMLGTAVGAVIALAFAAFIGYSGYSSYQTAHGADESTGIPVNLSAIEDYYNSLTAED